MLDVVDGVSRDARHQRLPTTGADVVVELNDDEAAMVLLL